MRNFGASRISEVSQIIIIFNYNLLNRYLSIIYRDIITTSKGALCSYMSTLKDLGTGIYNFYLISMALII